MEKEPNVKIFVTHFNKPNYIYEDDVFVPIQAGKKNAKIDLGIQGDDTGDNISEKNPQYAELTTQYWVWKNYDLSNVDYVGFCHYRRYMAYNYKYNPLKFWNNFSKIDKSGLIFSLYGNISSIWSYVLGWSITLPFDFNKISKFSDAIKKKIDGNFDIYLPKQNLNLYQKPFYHLGLQNQTLYEILYKIIIMKYPEYQKTIGSISNSRWCNWCNIGIFKKELFFEYSIWLFDILFEFENQLKDKKLLDLGFKEPITAGVRFLGSLGERLFNLRIYHGRERYFKISNDANLLFFT